MNILKGLRKIFSADVQTETLDYSFIFPYSNDREIKRQQIWNNLQKGILFEEKQILIPWLTAFSELDKFAEQRKDRGDRTNWFLGEHKILDGFNSFVGVMKWITVKKSNPFSEIEEFLGFDYEGNQKFTFLKTRLTDLLGEPSNISLEKFSDFDLGAVEWINRNARIRLSAIEQFSCQYRLSIGLTDNKNR